MAMVAQAIANNGKLMQPTLVDRVRAADLTVLSQTKPQTMANAFNKDSADKLTTMMESVVTEANPQLAIDGIKVAAKTGTAQIGIDNSAIDGWGLVSRRRTIRRSPSRCWCITQMYTVRSPLARSCAR